MNGCTILLVWTVRSPSSLCWAWLLAAGCWWVGIYTSWLRCGRGCGLALMSWARPTTYSTSNSNSKHARMPRFTTRYNRQQRATTTHHITAQHNISFFFRTPGPRLVRCSVLAACRSSQQRSAFRPPPSPARPGTYYKSALAEYFTNILHSRIFTHFGNYGLYPGPGLPE